MKRQAQAQSAAHEARHAEVLALLQAVTQVRDGLAAELQSQRAALRRVLCFIK